MKQSLICLLLIFLFSMSYKRKNKKQLVIKKTNTVITKTNKTLTSKIQKNISQIFVSTLGKFYFNDDYYIPLFYKNEYSQKTDSILREGEKETYNDLENQRYVLRDIKNVNILLDVDGLDRLLVIDNKQTVIDTIKVKQFEYFSETIHSFFAATYEGKLGYEDLVVVELDTELSKRGMKKSPIFNSDSTLQRRIQTRLSLKLDYVYGCGETIIEGDTISYVSYSSYNPYTSSTYLLKNYEIKDSIRGNIILKTLTPVPIAAENKGFYVTKAGMPESDDIWKQTLSIDFKNYKLKLYNKNRINNRH